MNERGNRFLRNLDFYAGIPLVFILGLLRPRKKSLHQINRAALLATGAIGDSIILSAVIRDFREHHLQAKITLYCTDSNHAVFEMFFPEMNMIRLPIANPFQCIKIIRKEKYDIFIDFGPWPRINAILAWFARAKCRAGFKSQGQHRHFVYDIVAEHRSDCHEIDNLRRMAKFFAVRSTSLPYLGKSHPDRKNPYVVVHMFPSGYKSHYKEWSDEKWMVLIDGLGKRGYKVCLTGGNADRTAAQRIAGQCQNQDLITILAGETDLQQVTEILKNAMLVISVNTGIMHLAAAVNQRIFALNGPTSPLRWGPLCENALNFNATTKGAGCLHLGFEYDDDDPNSLDSIDAKEILACALDYLGKM